jgi:peptide/nickel transport system permease protein
MGRYLLRRTSFLLASLLLAASLLFVLLRLLPGDPANALVSVGATPEQLAAARRQIGSDLPLPEQFASWLGGLARLDLGTSFVSKLPVGSEIAARLAVTVPLTLLAFALAVVVALPVGFLAAWRSDRWYGSSGSACCW